MPRGEESHNREGGFNKVKYCWDFKWDEDSDKLFIFCDVEIHSSYCIVGPRNGSRIRKEMKILGRLAWCIKGEIKTRNAYEVHKSRSGEVYLNKPVRRRRGWEQSNWVSIQMIIRSKVWPQNWVDIMERKKQILEMRLSRPWCRIGVRPIF